MRKISIGDKRTLDAEFTGQLLKIPKIKSELAKYANAFVQLFDADTYRLFATEQKQGLPINELCELVVKGGLGLEMLRALDANKPLNGLEWGTYTGDCDLNLLIRAEKYPRGWMTGPVLAAVAQRIKVLLVQAIDATRYSTFVQDLDKAKQSLVDPLFRCDKFAAAARLLGFVADDLEIEVDLETLGGVIALFSSLVPDIVKRAGPDMQKVFDFVLKSSSDDFLVYQKDGLLFVSNLQYVRSSWADVDYSFFPYAPGRMDSLGFEASELAQRQREARQVERTELPYDIFKVTSTPFQFTDSEITNDHVDPKDDRLHTAEDVGLNLNATNQKQSPYNLSMYANNVIDDFDLIRAALLFPGFAVTRADDEVPVVTRGTAKCEFVDVAIPRIGAPEWFYLQDREYFVSPPPRGNKASSLKIANWSYQTEENLNLLIEASVGQSHSEHKLAKRIDRLCEAWWKCELIILPPKNYDVPTFLVDNYASDYAGLFGMTALGDAEKALVNGNLGRVSKALSAYKTSQVKPKTAEIKAVRKATQILGQTGLCAMLTGAEINDGPIVAELRSVVSSGGVKVNWSMAAYLLIKAGAVNDTIWFPRDMMSFQVVDASKVAELGKLFRPTVDLKVGDIVLFNLAPRFEDDLHPQVQYSWPSEQTASLLDTTRIRYEGELTLSTQRLLNELRELLAHANNQLLRIAYGQIISTLSRVAADSYMRNVIPIDG